MGIDIKKKSAEDSIQDKLFFLWTIRYLHSRIHSQKAIVKSINAHLSKPISEADLSRYLSGGALPSGSRLEELLTILVSAVYSELEFQTILEEHSRILELNEIIQIDFSYLLNDNRALSIVSHLATRRELVSTLGTKMKLNTVKVDKIVTIEVDGIPFAFSIAKALNNLDVTYIRRNPPIELLEQATTSGFLYMPSDGRLTGFYLPQNSIKPNERVLIVYDVIGTGSSFKNILRLLEKVGAHPVGLITLGSHNRFDAKSVEIPIFVLNQQPK